MPLPYGTPRIGLVDWDETVDFVNALEAHVQALQGQIPDASGGYVTRVGTGPVAAAQIGATGQGNLVPGARHSVIAPDGAGSNAFPGMTLRSDGALLAIWRQAPGHGVSLDGNLVASTSTDLGASWSTPVELFADPSHDQRDAWVLRRGDGSLVLSYFKSTPADGVVDSVLRFSTDDGDTWGPEVSIPFGFTDWGAVLSITEDATGALVAAGYGKNTGDTYDSARVVRSTTDGATWGAPVTVATSGSQSFNETVVGLLPDGATLMALIRSDDGSGGGTNPGIYRSTSADNGATWSSPSLVLDGYGRPGWVTLDSGALVASYRKFGGRREHLVATSWDDGATWTAPVLLHPSTVTQQSVYSQLVEVSPGLVGVVYCDEITATNSMTRFKWLTAGAGVTPLGDSRLSPQRRFISADTLRAAGANPAATANTINNQRTWNFADATTQHIAGYVEVPEDWTTLDINAIWAPSTTSTGNARMDTSYMWVQVGSTANTSGTYVSGGAHAASGTVGMVQRSVLAQGIARAPEALLSVRVIRLGGDAADTFTGVVQLLGIEITKAS